eukprot:CAMPEP_0194662726 /NCGR_PEP_ID=MMETSP0295-20121207/374_1 /TAXON_ID=39354 /ORGANISM="Heterosigma akashiwo, Strain CCMP2393" /LENGTH=152 /DNA_ID=CAMNT_0039544005 /DNA_START=92 /DNA_END=546 /DNA_ORIENTATION=-
MGIGSSTVRGSSGGEKRGSDMTKERYYGLENFGNTCYCNSVLQSLYHIEPLRTNLLKYHASKEPPPQNELEKWSLAACLGDLFQELTERKNYSSSRVGKRIVGGHSGYLSPKRFFRRLQQLNPMFEGYIQQDAHEFLNFLLNDLADGLADEA